MRFRQRIFAAGLALALLAAPTATLAAANDKTEVIYAKMGTDGQIEEVLAVNGFEQPRDELVDYGAYNEIINLTNTDPITQIGDKIEIETEEFPFYYQGKLRDAQLPWLVELRYRLDGEEVSAEDLAGKSGDFSLQIEVRPNEKAERAFAESYLLQIMINLPADRFSAIEAEGGTIATQGETGTVSFAVMPGEEADYTVTARGTDIELGAIQMAGLPFSMDFELPDLSETTDDLVALQDAIGQLTDGVDDFTDGVGSIYDATGQLKAGAQGLAGGAHQLADGMSEMASGMHTYQAGLDRYVSELEQGIGQMEIPSFDTGGLSALTDGSAQLYSGLQQLEAGMAHLRPDAEFGRGLDAVSQGAAELSVGLTQLMHGNGEQPGLLDSSAAINTALAQMAEGFSAGMPEVDEEGLQALRAGLQGLSGGLQRFADGLGAGVQGLDPAQLTAITDGLYGLQSSLQESVDTLRNPGVDLSALDAETNPEALALAEVMQTEATRIEASLAAIDPAIAVLENTGGLIAGIETMQGSTLQMVEGLQTAAAEIGAVDLHTLTQGIGQLAGGISELSAQYAQFDAGLRTGLTGIAAGLDNAGGETQGLVQGLEQLQTGYRAMTVPLISGMAALVPGAGGLSTGLAQMAQMMEGMAAQLDVQDDLAALISGSRQLRDGHAAITGGAQDLSAGMRDYACGVDEYVAGMVRFQEGMLALAGGGNELTQGMRTLESETAGMDTQMQERMDDIMDSFLPEDAPDISFVSKKITEPVRVQFLYMTQPVHAPEEEAEEVVVEEERSIWERILDLFR